MRAPRDLKRSLVLNGTDAERTEEIRYAAENPNFLSYAVSVYDSQSSSIEEELDRILKTRKNVGTNLAKKANKHFGGPGIDYDWDTNGRRTRGFALVRGRKTFLIEFSAPSNQKALKSADAYGEIADAYLQSFSFLSAADILKADVYSSNDSSEWQDYDSDDDGFKVRLPGAPARSAIQVQTALRIVPQTEYSLKTASIRYLITVQDYSIDMNDQAAIDKLIDGVRAAFIKRGLNPIDDQRVSVGGSSGREIRFDSPGLAISSRLTFSHGRFYSIMAIYNKSQTVLPVLKNAVDSSITQFFGSFQLSLPKSLRSSAADLAVPNGFFGEINGENYKNDYFSFRLTAPKGWTPASSESNKMILQAGSDMIAAQDPDALKKLRSPEKVLAVFRLKATGAQGNASLMIDTVRAPYPKVDLIGSIKSQEKMYGGLAGSRVTVSTTVTQLQGRDAAFFERETVLNGTTLRQRIVGITHESYMVLFILSATDPENFKLLDDAMRTLRFLR